MPRRKIFFTIFDFCARHFFLTSKKGKKIFLLGSALMRGAAGNSLGRLGIPPPQTPSCRAVLASIIYLENTES
jgi:hypothetical protein